MATTDRLLFDISARDRASKVFDKVSKSADKSNSSFKKLGSGISVAAGAAARSIAGIAVAAGVGVTIFAKGAIAEAREAQKVTATTGAIIKSTGGAAKTSAAQIGALTTKLSLQSGIDDELIQQGANLILTFKNIRNETGKNNNIFDRATAAAVDLSKAGFGSIDSASKQLGKALNDPVKGITALNRAGVTFTAEQKKRIKGLVEEGDILSAQKIILKEVESQVGGVAKASATAGDKAKVAFQNFQEVVGTALLPLLDKVLNAIAAILPKILEIGAIVADKLKPAFENAKTFVVGLFDSLRAGTDNGKQGLTVLSSLFETFKQALKVAGPILQQIGTLIGTVFAQLATTVGPIIAQIAKAITQAFVQAAPQIKSALTSIQEIITNVLALIKILWESGFGKFIIDTVKNSFSTILAVVSGVLKAVSGVIKLVLAIIHGDWSGAWKALQQIVSGVKSALLAIVRGLSKQLVSILRLGLSLLKGIFGKAFNSARTAVADQISKLLKTIRELPGRIKRGLGNLASLLKGAGKAIVAGLVSGIKSAAGSAVRAARGVVSDAISGAKRLLHIGSPSKVFEKFGEQTVQGYVKGLQSGMGGTSGVRPAMSGLIGVGARSLARPRAASGGAATVVLRNEGVIGSRQELHNWLSTGLDTLHRQGRLRFASG